MCVITRTQDKPSMAAKLNSSISDYESNFQADLFRDLFTLGTKDCGPGEREWVENFARMFHDVFSTHKPAQRLLDVGCGPTQRNIMSASGKYSNITLSDPLPQNRRIQQQYMADASCDQQLTPLFRLTAKLETGDEERWPEVRDRLRSCIKDIIWCDVLQDDVLGKQADELYDCVTSSLCLESACKDVPTFTKSVKNLVSLVKPGGHLVLSGALGTPNYMIGDKWFVALELTEDVIRRSIEEAGCAVKSFAVYKPVLSGNPLCKGLFVVDAVKTCTTADTK